MPTERFRRRWLCLAAALITAIGCADDATTSSSVAAQAAETVEPAKLTGPASPEEAARVLDLRQLTLLHAKDEPARSIARLTYTAMAAVPDAFEFHKKQLLDHRWKELAGGYASPESASGTFTRGGFTLALSATNLGAGGDQQETMVSAVNLGNIKLSDLPKLAEATQLYDFPATVAYVTAERIDVTAKSMRELLMQAGWAPYGNAGDSQYFKQQGIKLTVSTMSAPAQGGKTVIQLSAEQLSSDLPAPADAMRVQYSESPTQLSVDFKGSLEQADKWYREQLGKLDWKPTTDAPVKQSFEYFVIYRHDNQALLEITFREVDDFTRLVIEYMTPEEFAAMEKRWEEQERKQAKAEEAKQRPSERP